MFEERQLDQVFRLLARVAQALAAVAGQTCQVTVHDLRTFRHAVIASHGAPSGRPVPPLPLPSVGGRSGDDIVVETIETLAGHEATSAVVWVRDMSGHVVGAVRLTMDFGDARAARDLLNSLLADAAQVEAETPSPPLASSADETIAAALDDALRALGKPRHQLDRDDRVAVVRALDQAGIFALRRSADIVARELGLSRGSVYAYLRDARGDILSAAGDG